MSTWNVLECFEACVWDFGNAPGRSDKKKMKETFKLPSFPVTAKPGL